MRQACMLFLILLTIGGCTTAPGALTLELTASKRVYTPQEPVVVSAVLGAVDGPVCLAKPAIFRVELTQEDTGQTLRGEPVVRNAGTSRVVMMPVNWFMIAFSFLDVADLSDRFVVLNRGGLQPQQFAVLRTSEDDLFVMPVDPSAPADERVMISVHGSQPLATGQYRLRATLTSRLNPYRWTSRFPTPAFWNAYNQPVSAEVTFAVTGLPTGAPSAPAAQEPAAKQPIEQAPSPDAEAPAS